MSLLPSFNGPKTSSYVITMSLESIRIPKGLNVFLNMLEIELKEILRFHFRKCVARITCTGIHEGFRTLSFNIVEFFLLIKVQNYLDENRHAEWETLAEKNPQYTFLQETMPFFLLMGVCNWQVREIVITSPQLS